ncbi:hypothetical protein O181_081668 [Austropuccinia psidii MF-1]|uniref:Uncharacterized protein n=1 Tax=Austropuccinia psidii MF-1 TaxID=1389203 RepID=A0A9Q3FL15_9BASI|nr:hypothetical protein [Austropuccinia psidii MF-1]
MQDSLLIQSKKKWKRRGKKSYTPGASPSKLKLPMHARPEDSQISPRPGPTTTSTPKIEQRLQSISNKLFFSAPNHPSPLQKEIPKVTSPVVKIRAKDYNLALDHNELETIIKRVEAATEIKGASG